jgi:Domain of unknown function (DUF4157)
MGNQAQVTVQTQQKTVAGQKIATGHPQGVPLHRSILQHAAVIPPIMQVHSGLLQRCSGGVECEECRQRRLEGEGMIQRAAVTAAPGNGVPPIVHEVLGAPGQPLDKATRTFMEPRFGHDFSQVRVHSDARAAESARTVNALAYTVGRDVVFGSGRYAPETSEGRKLLAHELTHVVQQKNSPQFSCQLEISDPADTLEREANTIANAISRNREPPFANNLVRNPILARFDGAAAPVEAEPFEAEPFEAEPFEAEPPEEKEEAKRRKPIEAPQRHRYATPPRSFEEFLEREARAIERKRDIAKAERAVATLERGGKPPDFITFVREQLGVWSWGKARYKMRSFHVLDAIEYEISRANNEQDLAQVLVNYIPDSLISPTFSFPYEVGRITPILPHRWDIVIPPNIDPGATVRMQTYTLAIRKRIQQIPNLRRSPLAAAMADLLLPEKVKRREGPCKAREVERAGGYPPHDAYALSVTGSQYDYLITTPEGIVCLTDGIDKSGTTWEVKTGLRYLDNPGILFSPKFQNIIFDIEAQRARCVYVTSRCGFPYVYALRHKEIVDYLNVLWKGIPPVVHRSYP